MMKKNKRILAALMALSMCTVIFTSCGKKTNDNASSAASTKAQSQAEKTQIKVATLKGPTGIGMVKLMSDDENNTTQNDYTFEIAAAPDQITGKIISGALDIAAVPTNLAATLYNKTEGKVSILAVNTLGVLYLLTKGEDISTVADLKGKTIYASGQGATPEFVLNYILKQNNIDPSKDVNIVYKAEHAELATLMTAGKASIAVLPQPFVTSVTGKDSEIKVALDLTKEWETAVKTTDKPLAMGSIIVRNEFLQNNKAAVDRFLAEYKSSTDYAVNNVDAVAPLVEKYDIMTAAVAKKAIPDCNIVYLDGDVMKRGVSAFLEILFSADTKSVGGKLPDDSFYYKK